MKTQTFNKEDCYASKRTILSLCFTKSYYFYFQWKKGGKAEGKTRNVFNQLNSYCYVP